MAWRIAESLEALRRQLNAAFPNRSKVSDGGIGDAAHASRGSDHNPYIKDNKGIGVVTARDFTHDPDGGIDCHWLARQLVKERDPRIKYIIWNKQICSSKTAPWTWRPYSGVNAHRHHLHLSVIGEQRLYDDTKPWDLDIAQTDTTPQIDSTKEFPKTSAEQIFKPGSVLEKQTFEPSPINVSEMPSVATEPFTGENAPETDAIENANTSEQGQTTKIEMSEGKIKAEMSSPDTPPEKVAVEGEKPMNFGQQIKADIAGTGILNLGVQPLMDYFQQVVAFGLSPSFWKTIGIIVGIASLAYLVLKYLRWSKKKDVDVKRTDMLVAANTTPNNKVTIAATEDLDKLKEHGYTIIRRGE